MFGYGCVGQGLHDVLNSSKGFKADIVRICVKDRTKKRRIPMSNFTFDKNDILNDPSINLVVELIEEDIQITLDEVKELRKMEPDGKVDLGEFEIDEYIVDMEFRGRD